MLGTDWVNFGLNARERAAVVRGCEHVHFQWDIGGTQAPRFLHRASKHSASPSSKQPLLDNPAPTVHCSFVFEAFELHFFSDL